MEKVDLLLKRLSSAYGETTTCFLNYKQPHELLICAILSAQARDEVVNSTTPALFDKYKSIGEFASADLPELEQMVSRIGLYRRKASYIKQCCQILEQEHNGVLPDTLFYLVKLPGVGRKVANLILMEIYGHSTVVVDTHVQRLCSRLGLAGGDAYEVELRLQQIIPEPKWNVLTRQLIQHGRAVCDAKNPRCAQCTLVDICPTGGVNNPIE